MYLHSQEQLSLKGVRNKFPPGVLVADIGANPFYCGCFLQFSYTYMLSDMCVDGDVGVWKGNSNC